MTGYNCKREGLLSKSTSFLLVSRAGLLSESLACELMYVGKIARLLRVFLVLLLEVKFKLLIM